MIKNGEVIDETNFNLFSGFNAYEDITAGDAVAMRSDFTIWKAGAANFDGRLNFIGFAMETVATGNPVKVDIQTFVSPVGGSYTANSTYFLSNTNGALATTAGTYERKVGRAISSTMLVRKRGVVSAPIVVAGNGATSNQNEITIPHTAIVLVGLESAAGADMVGFAGKYVEVDSTDDGTASSIVDAYAVVDERVVNGDFVITFLDFGQVF